MGQLFFDNLKWKGILKVKTKKPMKKSYTVLSLIKSYRDIKAENPEEACEIAFNRLMHWIDSKNVKLEPNLLKPNIVVGDNDITFFWEKKEVTPEEFCEKLPESFHEIFSHKLIKELFYRNPSIKCWRTFWQYVSRFSKWS
jgi:hypothetical protein